MQFVIKVLVSALIIASVSEIAKRSSLVAAVIASLPLTSILAMLWLYRETSDAGKVAQLSYGVFWMVIPSLIFFISFPLLVRKGLSFSLSMGISCTTTALSYTVYTWCLGKVGIQL